MCVCKHDDGSLQMSKADRLLVEVRARCEQGDLRHALGICRQALKEDPNGLDGVRLYANVLERLEEYEELTELLDQAVERWPRNDEFGMSRSRVYASLGHFEVARAGYLAVLENTPGHVDAVCALVQSGEGDAVGGLARVETLLTEVDDKSPEQYKLGYARARLLEAEGHFDEAFEAFREANQRHASAGGMDIRSKQKAAVTVIRDLNPAVIERFRGKGHPSERPVFIVGMPRSGTSLTEQVLSRHPAIHSTGEQTILGEVLKDLISLAPKARDVPLVESIDGLVADIWHRAGGKYLRRLDEINAGSQRISDKLPANFALLPWIRLLLPGARVIHVRRHPLATLSSCIRTPFADPLLSFSLEDWGRFYGLYEAMMEQWQPMMGGQMLEVEYENLVGDLPGETRRMLEFLSLDWHEDCLHPERAQRAVRTASWKQVRHGVHTGSVDRWRRYETQLAAIQPFIRQSREAIDTQKHDGTSRE